MNTMNIFAEHGDKVIASYLNNGWDIDIETAKKYLTEGQTYTVDYTEVHRSSTDVYLLEIPNVCFNSVQFSDAPNTELFSINHDGEHLYYGFKCCSCKRKNLLDKKVISSTDSNRFSCSYCTKINVPNGELKMEVDSNG